VIRDKIAVDIGISPDAVSNIVSEWRNHTGSYAADELRSFAVTLRKIGLTPSGVRCRFECYDVEEVRII
jgi:hypothetical protein